MPDIPCRTSSNWRVVGQQDRLFVHIGRGVTMVLVVRVFGGVGIRMMLVLLLV